MKVFTDKVERISVPKPIEIGLKAREMRRQGHEIIDLSMGQPDFMPSLDPESVRELVLEPLAHAYSDSQGIKPLRDALANYLGTKHDIQAVPEELLITPGAKLGIYYVLSSILEKNESVVIPQPSWVSYAELANWNENAFVTVSGSADRRFLSTIEGILGKVTENTKAVIVNSPVNPTGVIWPKEELLYLYSELSRRNTFLILDAIYDDFDFDYRSVRLSEFRTRGIPDFLIYVHGFSKVFSMAGHRLGYIAAGKELISQMTKVQAQLMTCPSTFSQRLALKVLEKSGEAEIRNQVAVYARRSRAVAAMLDSYGIEYTMPDGAFYILVDTSYIDHDSVKAAKIILEKCQVATVPGVAFGTSTEGRVRITLVEPDERILAGIKRICELQGPEEKE